MLVRSFVLGLCAAPLFAQTVCQPTPVWSPCDVTFELSAQDAAAHPNPYKSVELEIEFRSPRHRTMLMPGFWDGGNRMVVRFAPTEPGQWDFRVASNIAAWNDKEGSVAATPSDAPGFVYPANVHHWATNEGELRKPHLWMGDTMYTFGFIDRGLFQTIVDKRAEQKFNHMRGVILPRTDQPSVSFTKADQPNTDCFRELDSRIRYMNSKGITADLVLGWDEDRLAKWFPEAEQRQRYIRYVVARYAPMNITWQGVQEFEEYTHGRDLLKEMGGLLKKLDPYQHPRSTHTVATSAPLLSDGWMDYVTYQSSDDQLGAIEHQLYPVPFVNAEFAYEDSGAGHSHPHHVDSDTFRKRLWNATMDGQYPTYGNTGTYGVGFPVDAKYLDSPGARAMTAWYDFFSGTRYWELEPYFDVDGGRALALEGIGEDGNEGVEYIVYVEKPGPVEIVVDKRSYDVFWFNPITGERKKEKREFKGDRFAGEPPDNTHDWVLQLSREGKKESMGRSYKFESRRIVMQEVEVSRTKVPFEMTAPKGDISFQNPGEYAAKVTRDTQATRSMMWLWTGEVTARGQGYRVIGTGQQGKIKLPPGLAVGLPATLGIRVYGMNLHGKVYSLDKFVELTK